MSLRACMRLVLSWVLFGAGYTMEWASQVEFPVDLRTLELTAVNMTTYEDVCVFAGTYHCIASYAHARTRGECFFQGEWGLFSVQRFNQNCDFPGVTFEDVLVHCIHARTQAEEANLLILGQVCSPSAHVRLGGGVLVDQEEWSGRFLSDLCYPGPRSRTEHFGSLCTTGFCLSAQGSLLSEEACASMCAVFATSYSGTYQEADATICGTSPPLCTLAKNLTALCGQGGVPNRRETQGVWHQYLTFPSDRSGAIATRTVCSPGYPYAPPCDAYRGCRNRTLTDCAVPNMTCEDTPALWPHQKTCTCPPDYTGPSCAEGVDDCTGHACVHGLCVDGYATYRCACDNGWTGIRCDVNRDECAEAHPVDLCGKYGTCVDVSPGYECVCLSGWETEAGPESPCTIQVPCRTKSEYFDTDARHCLACGPSCAECRGPAATQCTACPTATLLSSLPVGECLPVESGRFQVTREIRMAMLGLMGAYVAILLAYGLLRRAHAEADNMAIVTYGVAVVNLATDVLFTSSIASSPRLFATCTFLVAVTCGFNVLGTGYFFVRYMRDTGVGAWVEHNHALVTITVFFGAATIQVLRILSSHILDADKLKVIFPEYAMTRVKILSVFTLFIQDLPQLCVQVYYGATYTVFNPFMLVSICASMVSIVFGVASRVFLCMAISRKSERVDMANPGQQQSGSRPPRVEPTGLETFELEVMDPSRRIRTARDAIVDSMRSPRELLRRERLLGPGESDLG